MTATTTPPLSATESLLRLALRRVQQGGMRLTHNGLFLDRGMRIPVSVEAMFAPALAGGLLALGPVDDADDGQPVVLAPAGVLCAARLEMRHDDSSGDLPRRRPRPPGGGAGEGVAPQPVEGSPDSPAGWGAHLFITVAELEFPP